MADETSSEQIEDLAVDAQMELADMYGSDSTLERDGIPLKRGRMTFLIARSGGGNLRYTKVLTAKTKPHRRTLQMAAKNMDERSLRLLQRLQMETFAEACMLGWEHEIHGKGKAVDKTGKILDFSVANCMLLFDQMPALFDDLASEADNIAAFRQEAIEASAKN